MTFTQDLTGSDTGSSRGLEESKCIRKSDLVLYRGSQSTSSTTKNTDSVQRCPKRLRISASCKKVLACAPNTRTIQMVVLGVSGKLSLVNYNLQSGKKDSQSRFLCDAKYILGNSENNIKLATGGRVRFQNKNTVQSLQIRLKDDTKIVSMQVRKTHFKKFPECWKLIHFLFSRMVSQ